MNADEHGLGPDTLDPYRIKIEHVAVESLEKARASLTLLARNEPQGERQSLFRCWLYLLDEAVGDLKRLPPFASNDNRRDPS